MVGVAWTLTFEWMFYLFFLACILAGRRWLWIGCAIWATVIVSLGHLDTKEWSPWLQVPTSPYVIQFLCGVVAAEMFRRVPRAGPRLNVGVGAIALGLLLAGVVFAPFNLTPRQWDGPTDMAFGRYFWGAAFGLTVWWAAANDERLRVRWLLPMLVIGNASYALYLFHNEMLQAFIRIGHALGVFQFGPAVFWMWAYALGLLVMCVAIHFMIERPMLAWSRRWISRRKPASPAATSGEK